MMGLRCIAGRHDVAPGEVRYQGFGFSRCRRCGRDMVRSARAWRIVPNGFRVVWRQGPPPRAASSPAQLRFDLPAAGRALLAPAGKGRGRPIGMVFLGLAGLRCLGWAAAGRVRAWRQALRAPRRAGPVIRLAPCPQSQMTGS
jgi:hypothetical protein